MDAIKASGVTKTFRIGVGRARVREMLPWPVDRAVARLFPRWWTKNTFNALEDVSLEVASGSSVAIVGHNGAGKTTMLKIIAGVMAPTSGRVTRSGHVGAVLDVMSGFHPDLTGRENAHVLATIHRVRRRDMASCIERSLQFAEIEELADTPIKRYSTGMQARLGFSVLTAIDPSVLLIDEVLAVGDAAFQRKCAEWLDDFRARGGTLVFVSHNLALVRSMTESAIWLDHGHKLAEGPTPEIIAQYTKAMERRDAVPAGRRGRRGPIRVAKTSGLDRWGAGGARVEEVHLGQSSEENGRLDVSIQYANRSLDRAIFCIGFVNEAGVEIGAAASPIVSVADGEGRVRCEIQPLPLRAGIYFPVAAILSADGRVEDRWTLDRPMVVEGDGELVQADDFGPVRIGSEWSEDG